MRHAPAADGGLVEPGTRLRDVRHVEDVVAALCWPFATAPGRPAGDRRVGLEAEAPAVRVSSDGSPDGRLTVAALAAHLDDALGPNPIGGPGWRTSEDDVVTLEPGGQVEVSTAVRASPEAALGALDVATDEVLDLLAPSGAVLLPLGSDPWQGLDEVAQQLDAPRYRAMDDAFALRGGAEGPGARMMRLTASLQVNIDLGPDEATALERWHVATIASPVLAAIFRSSIGNARARAWRGLDPTRTGPGPGLGAGVSGARAIALLTAAALDADVLLMPSGEVRGGGLTAGTPGATFRAWLARGGAGGPTVADLDRHLTTLWHDVRVRGFLELRAIDAVPRPLQPAVVAVVCGLLLDPAARAQGRALMQPWAEHRAQLVERCEGPGVRDPRICALAVELSALALEGAGRIMGCEGAWAVRVGEEHLDARTMRGLAPVDELTALLPDPAAALAWAAAAPSHRPRSAGRLPQPSEQEPR